GYCERPPAKPRSSTARHTFVLSRPCLLGRVDGRPRQPPAAEPPGRSAGPPRSHRTTRRRRALCCRTVRAVETLEQPVLGGLYVLHDPGLPERGVKIGAVWSSPIARRLRDHRCSWPWLEIAFEVVVVAGDPVWVRE